MNSISISSGGRLILHESSPQHHNILSLLILEDVDIAEILILKILHKFNIPLSYILIISHYVISDMVEMRVEFGVLVF